MSVGVPMRMMTAQEALDLFGYILILSEEPLKDGQVFDNAVDGILPIGVKLVVVGPMSKQEYDDFGTRTRWDQHAGSGTDPTRVHRYKAVAE